MTKNDIPANSPLGLLKTAFNSPTPSDALAAINALRERLDEQEQQIVFTERLHGASWQRIADLTGIKSRQAAQHRYEKGAGLLDRLDIAVGRPVPE